MLFAVSKDVFSLFPTYIVGVVVARDIANHGQIPSEILTSACERARVTLGPDPKQHPLINVWREAFRQVGYNPNRFPPSIDALASRVVKTNFIPSINPAVDIINAHSVTYLVPMGAHDISLMKGNLEVRKSRPGEPFTPMGGASKEYVQEEEIVYADNLEIRTRRWIWRQGDLAKVTADTTVLFCPIDGFSDSSRHAVLAARASLAHALKTHLKCETDEYLIDINSPSVTIA